MPDWKASLCYDNFDNLRKLAGISGSKWVLAHCSACRLLSLPYGVGTWQRHKITDGTKISIVFHSRTVSHTELNYAKMDTEAFCTRSFISDLYICAFIICINKTPLGILSEVKLLPLIIKHRGALLNTNDHINWKNNIEGWQPEHLPTLIPESPNHLPWRYWCKTFFLILIYRLIKFMSLTLLDTRKS